MKFVVQAHKEIQSNSKLMTKVALKLKGVLSNLHHTKAPQLLCFNVFNMVSPIQEGPEKQ